MSKYEELCNAFGLAYDNLDEYGIACGKFAHKLLVNGMTEYLECPKGKVEPFPVFEEPDPMYHYTTRAAMRLCDDGFYHLGVRIIVHRYGINDGIHSQHHLSLHVLIRRDESIFTVRLKDHPQKFEIHDDDPGEMTAFHNFIFNEMKQVYSTNFLPTPDKKSPIGFARPELPAESEGT